MAVYNYDVVVLGSGPAGEGAAMNAAKAGRKVAVVDNRPLVGGNCTHLGTIPSKALRHSVRQIMQYNTNPLFRQIGEPRWFSFPDVLKSAERVIAKQVASRTGYYARNRIDVFFGTASFSDEQTVEVVCASGVVEKLVAKQIVIATGSRPYRPADVDFHHPRIYDSDTILSLTHTPRRIIIYGAGVIGSEYASIFSGLGVLVDLIDNRDEQYARASAPADWWTDAPDVLGGRDLVAGGSWAAVGLTSNDTPSGPVTVDVTTTITGPDGSITTSTIIKANYEGKYVQPCFKNQTT